MVLNPTTASTISRHATAGHTYLVQLVGNPVSGMGFATVNASPATKVQTLNGTVSIGIG